jgi:hypothetical protein
MARTGHDSERAAMIYQHQAQGADKAITSAIESRVQAEQASETTTKTGRPACWSRWLMTR